MFLNLHIHSISQKSNILTKHTNLQGLELSSEFRSSFIYHVRNVGHRELKSTREDQIQWRHVHTEFYEYLLTPINNRYWRCIQVPLRNILLFTELEDVFPFSKLEGILEYPSKYISLIKKTSLQLLCSVTIQEPVQKWNLKLAAPDQGQDTLRG
jgi:hypothetical protein